MKRTTQQRARNIMTTMSTWRSFTSKTTHFILIGCFWNVKNEGDKQDKGGMAQQNTSLQPAKDLDSYCIDKYNTVVHGVDGRAFPSEIDARIKWKLSKCVRMVHWLRLWPQSQMMILYFFLFFSLGNH